MAEQLSFLEPAEPARDRLFFAILPDADTAERIGDLAQRLRGEHELKGRPVATDRLHVTLHFLGDYSGLPTDIVANACEAAAGLAQQAFYVAFDHVVSFSSTPRNRPLVLRGGEGLDALILFQRDLVLALGTVMQGRRSSASLTPHVTLLYDDKSVAEQKVELIGWNAREFVLIHSVIGEGRYRPIGRWELG